MKRRFSAQRCSQQYRNLWSIQVRSAAACRGKMEHINSTPEIKRFCVQHIVYSKHHKTLFLCLLYVLHHVFKQRCLYYFSFFVDGKLSRIFCCVLISAPLWTVCRLYTRVPDREKQQQKLWKLSPWHLLSHIQPLQRKCGGSPEFSAYLKAAYVREA